MFGRKQKSFFVKKNVLSMLYFCKDAYKKMININQNSFEKQVDDYLKKTEGQPLSISIEEGVLKEEDSLSDAEKFIISTAYLGSITELVTKYTKHLVVVERFFPILSVTVTDFQKKNTKEAEAALNTLVRLSCEEVSDKEIMQLSDYIADIPANNKRFWLNLISGAVIYLNIVVILCIFMLSIMN